MFRRSSTKPSPYSPIPIGPKSISTKSNSKSSDSFGTKNMKEIAKIFALGVGKKLDNDTTGKVLDYLKTNQYQLINELLAIYPFEHKIYTKYAEYLALNPGIHSLIPKLIEKIRKDDPGKLGKFYKNLAQNTNKKVIPYLKIIYDDNPETDNLDWDALCNNPNAIKIVEKEYEKDSNSNNLKWFFLCKNPKAINMLKTECKNNPNKFGSLYWTFICENPKAIEILEEEYRKNPNKLEWEALCNNPKAINIIIMEYNKNPNSTNINWEALCNNPKAIKILEKEYKRHPDSTKIKWDILCKNPGAIGIIKKEYELDSTNIDWFALCENPEAIKILTIEYNKNPNSTNIKWDILSGNTNPDAIKLLDMEDVRDSSRRGTRSTRSTRTHLLNWNLISSNPNAINMIIRRLILEKKKKKFRNRSSYSRRHLKPKQIYIGNEEWKNLLQNPSIFTT